MSNIQKPSLLAVNFFKNKPGLALRKMLAEPNRFWTGPELAQVLGVQRIWAARILASFEFEKFAIREGQGAHSKFRLTNTEKLLQRWKLSYHIDFNEHHSYRVVGEDPLYLTAVAAKKEGFRFAVTGKAAKAIATKKPHKEAPLIYVWPHSGIKSDFEKILHTLEDDYDFIPTEKKPNVILLKPHDQEGVFEGVYLRNKIWVSSDLQQELDL